MRQRLPVPENHVQVAGSEVLFKVDAVVSDGAIESVSVGRPGLLESRHR
jgi:hypothetical protein